LSADDFNVVDVLALVSQQPKLADNLVDLGCVIANGKKVVSFESRMNIQELQTDAVRPNHQTTNLPIFTE